MHIILVKPRGFCAGVERAIKSVEQALELYGAPVYVLNHIVHNAHVVNELREKGAIFIRDIEEVPENAPLLFSAHGVGPDRWEVAEARNLKIIDATCPLVEKVHREARKFASNDYTIILIGEPGHDETIGTMGWAPDNIVLIRTVEDVENLEVEHPDMLAYITQTTLSVEDCKIVIDALKARFPNIESPTKADICYATSNRQAAIIQSTPEADLVLVVGDPESANSNRLAQVVRGLGTPAYLVPDATDIDPAWLEGVETVVITSGASVPEILVQNVVRYIQSIETCDVEERIHMKENQHFRLPKEVM